MITSPFRVNVSNEYVMKASVTLDFVLNWGALESSVVVDAVVIEAMVAE